MAPFLSHITTKCAKLEPISAISGFSTLKFGKNNVKYNHKIKEMINYKDIRR